MHRSGNVYVAEKCKQDYYDTPTLRNLNLRSTTQMLTCCKLSECSVLDKCPQQSGISPGILLEIW